MPYDIDKMRTALQEYVAPLFADGTTGEFVEQSFRSMQASNNRLAEQLPASCLIARNDGHGHAVVDCSRKTDNSHVIQEKVLRRISTSNPGRTEVLDFMHIDTIPLAKQCQGPDGEMWHKQPWDIERLPPQLVRTRSASARHFACNPCDKATFRLIEDVRIDWPSWPNSATIDDMHPNQDYGDLPEQLFLLAYRCLLQRMSQVRGSITADLHTANRLPITDHYQSVLKARIPRSRAAFAKLTNLKSKYDRRLVGVANLPMVHEVVPIEPAFQIASAAFTPAGHEHIATTVYPEQIERSDGTAGIKHWLVISVESGHRWALATKINALAVAAQQSTRNRGSSIDWTVNYVIADGSLNTYANPDSYEVFRAQHPTASDRIDRHIPDDIVVECYERYIGKALFNPEVTP